MTLNDSQPVPVNRKSNVLIDFVCAGVQKAGTTTLRAYLRAHPQLDVPDTEPHFFDDETANWSMPDVRRYHEGFSRLSSIQARGGGAINAQKLSGEVTPSYVYLRPCAERLHSYNPAIRIIVLLRNPMARAYSQWNMEMRRRLEHLPFGECVRRERERLAPYPPHRQHRVYSYIDRGRYHQQLMRLFALFDSRQVLVLKSESFFASPAETMRTVTGFLGVDSLPDCLIAPQRTGQYTTSMARADWEYMYRELSDDIAGVEALLGWDCSDWRRPMGIP